MKRSSVLDRIRSENTGSKPIDALDVDPASILDNPYQPRQFMDEGRLAELMQSIQEQGILEPLVVSRTDRPGIYELVAGGRRLAAARQLSLATVPVVVREFGSEDDKRLASITENWLRDDLSVEELAVGVQEVRRLTNWSATKIGQKFGKSADTIERLLLLASNPDAMVAYQRGDITLRQVRDYLRQPEQPADPHRADFDEQQAGATSATATSSGGASGRRPRKPADPFSWVGAASERATRLAEAATHRLNELEPEQASSRLEQAEVQLTQLANSIEQALERVRSAKPSRNATNRSPHK